MLCYILGLRSCSKSGVDCKIYQVHYHCRTYIYTISQLFGIPFFCGPLNREKKKKLWQRTPLSPAHAVDDTEKQTHQNRIQGRSTKYQTNELEYLGGDVSHNADLSIEADLRIRNAGRSFRKYALELYDRPSAPLEIKFRMLKAEVLEIILQYGCVTSSPRACYYDMLHQAYHSFLTLCIGCRKNIRTNHLISCLNTLIETGSESIDAIMRRRWVLFGDLWRAWRTRGCPTSA